MKEQVPSLQQALVPAPGIQHFHYTYPLNPGIGQRQIQSTKGELHEVQLISLGTWSRKPLNVFV